jgi:hypothetical protein
MIIEKLDFLKHIKLLSDYLLNLENNDKIYFFSLFQINLLSNKKDISVIIDDSKIINLFYIDNANNTIKFIFDYPLKEFYFLKKYDVVGVSFLKESNFNKSKIKRYYFSNEMIINNKDVLLLENKEFKNIFKKINHFKKNYNYNYELFNKNKVLKEDLVNFFNQWQEYAINVRNKLKANIKNDLDLVNLIYDNNYYTDKNLIKGIILKVDSKIIGICFYIFSPNNKYSISLISKTDVRFIGASEYIYYLSCKNQFCEKDIVFQNIGNLPYGPINRFKGKFNGLITKVYFGIIYEKEGSEIKDINYWIFDHI